jgi:SHS2 domain-containing protein
VVSAVDFERFEELEHTADTGLRVRGRTFAELCENAALGTYALIGEAAFAKHEVASRAVEVPCESFEDGLYEWLRAILVAFALDGFFAVGARVVVAERRLRGTLEGGRFDPGRHVFFTELKAVTRHALAVREMRDGFEAEVIFDV